PPPPPPPPPFPYTTLFRSPDDARQAASQSQGHPVRRERMIPVVQAFQQRIQGLEDRFPDRFLPRQPVQGGHEHAQAGQSVVEARSEEHTSELQSRENLVCR